MYRQENPPAKPLSSDPTLIYIGSLYTKVAPINKKIPEKFLSIVSITGHQGTVLNDYFEEQVATNAIELYSEVDYLYLSFPQNKDDPILKYWEEASHIIMYAIFGRPEFDHFSYPTIIPPFHFVGDVPKLIAGRFDTHWDTVYLESLEKSFYGIESGFVVDLGHYDTRLYAVSDGNVIDKKTMGFGGHDLNVFLNKLLQENKRQLTLKTPAYDVKAYEHYITGFVKEKECKVALNLEETLKSHGFVSCTADIVKLASDKESLFSLLPKEILGIVKQSYYDLLDKKTTLEKLGYIWSEDHSVTSGETILASYTIGPPETYVTMEALFWPPLIGRKDQKGIVEEVKDFVAKNPFVKAEITFCGGAVTCPGFAERIQSELENVVINEHLLFANVINSINKVGEQ